MDNASLSRKPPQASELVADEIPEAVRDHPYLEARPESVQEKRADLETARVGRISLWGQHLAAPQL